MISALLNSDAFYSGGLILLEVTFVLAALLMLHAMKNLIGSSSFYTAFGILIVFMHLIGAAGLVFLLDSAGLEFGVARTALLTPCLAVLLVVYAVDGTLAAQRLIIASMAGYGLFAYLGAICAVQCEWSGYSVSQGVMADILAKLLRETGQSMASGIVASAFDLFLIPMIYQKLRNFSFPLWMAVPVTLMLGSLLDLLIFFGVHFWGEEYDLMLLHTRLLPQLIPAVWCSLIVSIYLTRIGEQEPAGRSRSAVDIVLAFFSGYGRAKVLEQNLRESEQRWRTIIQNAEDAILITDSDGRIVDANRSARLSFGIEKVSGIIGTPLQELAEVTSVPAENGSVSHLLIRKKGKEDLKLEILQSPIFIGGMPARLLIGRDVTERERLAREREDLQRESYHRQRLESIGRLAGGIAHDFNNHIQAINGHLDLIYMGEVTKESLVHIEKIDAIAQQAGKLTSQLLGYARKGRRQNTRLELAPLLHDTLELFIPDSRTGIRMVTDVQKEPVFVTGDATQLRQMLLNLLMNARDAMESLPEQDRVLTVRVGLPEWMHAPLRPPPDAVHSEGPWCCIRVEDSGPGVPPEIREKIFEPFFTTKPTGKGTGMGLSMAFGAALEHDGWIQYDTSPAGGAAFTVILPGSADPDAQKKPS